MISLHIIFVHKMDQNVGLMLEQWHWFRDGKQQYTKGPNSIKKCQLRELFLLKHPGICP